MSGVLQALRRFFVLYLATVRFSVSRSLEFRFDFFFRFFMDVVYYAVSIGFFEIIFLHTASLGGWRHDEVLLFLSGALLLDGLHMTLVARNIWEFPSIVNKGELDFYLTRPVSPLLTLLIRNFECSSLLNVFVGVGFMAFALSNYAEPIGVMQLVGFFFLLANGFVLVLCIRMFAVLPVFWTHSRFGFHMLLHSFEQVLERPQVIFRGAAHLFFLTVVPLFVISSFPARWVFGTLGGWEVCYALFITTLFVLAVRLVWRRGLRVYASASS